MKSILQVINLCAFALACASSATAQIQLSHLGLNLQAFRELKEFIQPQINKDGSGGSWTYEREKDRLFLNVDINIDKDSDAALKLAKIASFSANGEKEKQNQEDTFTGKHLGDRAWRSYLLKDGTQLGGVKLVILRKNYVVVVKAMYPGLPDGSQKVITKPDQKLVEDIASSFLKQLEQGNS